MRATGIVIRIDDLGRVVIPKEIRKTLRIREGDPLEIFTAKDGEIILKKYSPIGEIDAFAEEFAETLSETLEFGIIITDLDTIIATSKVSKDYKEKAISSELEKYLEDRRLKSYDESKIIPVYKDDSMEYKEQIIVPILSLSRDCIGCVTIVSEEEGKLGENEENIAKIAAGFLGKQIQ